MSLFELSSILIAFAALSSYLNFRYVHLPMTIGVMLMSIGGSVLLIVLGIFFPTIHAVAVHLVGRVNFQQTVLHGMLAFLLFAGSLHVDLGDLRRQWGIITLLAGGGLILSTFIVAGLTWLLFMAIGVSLPLIYCLLFGALISPTDPIAVLAIMKGAGASRVLETQVSGESLFNDGVGVVVFLTVLGLTTGGKIPTWTHLGFLLLTQIVGGAGVGLLAGIWVFHLLKRVDSYQVEVLLTLALAMGSFTLAEEVHVSAPIAVVVAGLFMGNTGRSFAMSKVTEEHIDSFWELLDEILNALLFLLIGLELLVLPAASWLLVPCIAAIAIVLLARWASVGASVGLFRPFRKLEHGTVSILTWGGLRGGLSIAMALSLPSDSHREVIVAMTYSVVVFSVIMQGLTVGVLIRGVQKRGKAAEVVQS